MSTLNQAIATRLAIELKAIAIAMLVGFALLLATPANWFFDVAAIEVIERGGETLVRQSRRIWPGDILKVHWSAQIERAGEDSPGRVRVGRVVCQGEGVGTVRDDDYHHVEMSLDDWVGDPVCDPPRGAPLVLEGSWSYHLLGLRKTVSRRSPVFVLPPRPAAP